MRKKYKQSHLSFSWCNPRIIIDTIDKNSPINGYSVDVIDTIDMVDKISK
jgi:hypothetical protein